MIFELKQMYLQFHFIRGFKTIQFIFIRWQILLTMDENACRGGAPPLSSEGMHMNPEYLELLLQIIYNSSMNLLSFNSCTTLLHLGFFLLTDMHQHQVHLPFVQLLLLV